MPIETISFGRKVEGKIEKVGAVTFDMPATLDDAVQRWGDTIVLSLALQSLRIYIQNVARSCDSEESAQTAVDSWAPGVSRRGTTGGMSKKAIFEALKNIPSENLAELLKAAGVTKTEE